MTATPFLMIFVPALAGLLGLLVRDRIQAIAIALGGGPSP